MEISEFQKIMYELYAHNDRRRGGKATMLSLLRKLENLPKPSAEKSQKNRGRTCRLLRLDRALANLYGVDSKKLP